MTSTCRENPVPSFVFLVCQQGAEPTIKSHYLGDESPFRLAFSRPGLLTFKVVALDNPSAETPAETPVEPPEHWLVRQSGFALGQMKGENASQLVAQTLELLASEAPGVAFDALHVFARDAYLPGDRGFEPGPSPLGEMVRALFEDAFRSTPDGEQARSGNLTVKLDGPPTKLGANVLDIVLIEPDHWLIGYHVAKTPVQCWPGGALQISRPAHMINRAYLKMAEALDWCGLPIAAGDRLVEIGSAPGGASQRLLDLGVRVTGVDPAEMDPLLMEHPRFEHWRSKSSAVRRRRYSKFRWLVADANVAPQYTLEAVGDIVCYPTSRLEGLLLTLKLSSYELANQLEKYLARIRGWGFERVEARQLATNRRECCVVAQRSAAWKPPPFPKPRKTKKPVSAKR